MSSRSTTSTAVARRPEAPTLEQACFLLEVMSGTERGLTLSITGETLGPVYAGTSLACKLRLSDPLVSRRHASFVSEASTLRLVDLGSTNGTFVNGVRIVEAVLNGGETVTVGDSSIAVRRAGVDARVLPGASAFGRMLGTSAEMKRLYPFLARLSQSDVPVVIEGETGTGKEVLAEAIHEASPRASGPFMVFDCTACAASLLEANLFGHEKGAFTGALRGHAGVFERAHKGTLFIDEIGDLDVALQAKLLRAVQQQQVQRLGGDRWISVDVRILAATRRDLEREIQAGRFRDDLYYRLAVARVELPPLRRRTGDAAFLAMHFWSKLGGKGEPPPSLLARVEDYGWPGNVRELYNAVAHAVALGELSEVESLGRGRPSTAPPGPPRSDEDVIGQVIDERLPFHGARDRVLGAFHRRYLSWLLEEHGGNISKAAAAAGVARRYFYTLKDRVGGEE
jgi:two-component system, NtrC family, response regulator HydG